MHMPRHASPTGRTLVTGATGFVGAAVARRLARAGHGLRLTLRGPAPAGARWPAGAETVVVSDLAAPIDWGAALDSVDAVVHVAGAAHQPRGASDAALFKVNAEAAGRLAEAARRAGVRRFVLMSSVRAICGAWSEAVVTDATPPAPTDAYGRSKLVGEEAVLASVAGAAILRPTAVCGAGVKGHFAALARAAAGRWPLPLGGFKGRRAWISDENLAAAVEFLLARDALEGRFLVAEPEPLTPAEFIARMRASLSRPAGVLSVPRPLLRLSRALPGAAAMIDRLDRDLVVEASRLREAGFHPSEAGDAALARMVRAAQAGRPERSASA